MALLARGCAWKQSFKFQYGETHMSNENLNDTTILNLNSNMARLIYVSPIACLPLRPHLNSNMARLIWRFSGSHMSTEPEFKFQYGETHIYFYCYCSACIQNLNSNMARLISALAIDKGKPVKYLNSNMARLISTARNYIHMIF